MVFPSSLIPRLAHLFILSTALCGIFLLAACQTQVTAPTTTAVETDVTPVQARVAASTPEATAAATSETTLAVGSNELLRPEDAAPPAALRVPAVDMEVTVSPMTWRVSEVNGKRTTIWVLPNEGVGWHPNSAKVGTAGNVIISGNQLLGDASFAPIALGDIALDQEIEVTDSQGRIFIYRVVDVTEPLPISTSFEEEATLAAQYLSQGSTPTLTLISGWPDFSSTARIIVSAELVEATQ